MRSEELKKKEKRARFVIENISSKLTGGKRKVIDQTFKDTAEFRETKEGKFEE